jgi:hypothetical protein
MDNFLLRFLQKIKQLFCRHTPSQQYIYKLEDCYSKSLKFDAEIRDRHYAKYGLKCYNCDKRLK